MGLNRQRQHVQRDHYRLSSRGTTKYTFSIQIHPVNAVLRRPMDSQLKDHISDRRICPVPVVGPMQARSGYGPFAAVSLSGGCHGYLSLGWSEWGDALAVQLYDERRWNASSHRRLLRPRPLLYSIHRRWRYVPVLSTCGPIWSKPSYRETWHETFTSSGVPLESVSTAYAGPLPYLITNYAVRRANVSGSGRSCMVMTPTQT